MILAYVDRIQMVVKSNLLSNDGIRNLTSYISSYEDIIQGQNENTFLHNPLNVYKLIRHVVVGWPIVERVLKVVGISI